MPAFCQTSFSRLSTCHIDLQVLFFEVVRTFDCTILEGYRNEADQEAAVARGDSKLHYPHGKHNANPSMAVDAAPTPVNFDNTKLIMHFAGFVLGVASRLREEGKITHGIRWGGSWNGLGDLNAPGMLNDLVHFELV